MKFQLWQPRLSEAVVRKVIYTLFKWVINQQPILSNDLQILVSCHTFVQAESSMPYPYSQWHLFLVGMAPAGSFFTGIRGSGASAVSRIASATLKRSASS